MNVINNFLQAFWSSRVWLPPDFEWADLEPNEKIQFTNYRHLYTYTLLFAVIILVIRYVFERFCFAPIGRALKIKSSSSKKVKDNQLLEDAFQAGFKWKHKDILGYAKQLDWNERQVQRWLRLRKFQGKPSTLTKFCEHSWRCLYYTSSFLFGLAVLWDKSWLWNIDYCWINYPKQGVTDDVWWYYMISLAFYWSLMISQFFDVKRKDFWQMFVHHIATISLLSFSWICNLHRVGSLVLVLHDSADCILDAAKAVKYAKYEKVFTVLVVFFVLTWIATRIIIFPFWILRSTTVDGPRIAETMFPAYYIFNGLLLLLLVLHIFWTKLILQAVYNAITGGQVEDTRSCSSSSESEEKSKTSSPLPNGTPVMPENHVKSG